MLNESVTVKIVEMKIPIKVTLRTWAQNGLPQKLWDPPEGEELTEAVRLEINGTVLDLEEYRIPNHIKAMFTNVIIDEIHKQVERRAYDT